MSQDPFNSLRAYGLSWTAISLCNQVYGYSDHNDESDACRHFVWAALLVNSLGKDFANRILNAHEDEPEQPESERRMDLANNLKGLEAADRIIRKGKMESSALVEEFKRQLHDHKLIVLEPRIESKE